MNSDFYLTGPLETSRETLTVIIPAHNEAESLTGTVEDIITYEPKSFDCEVIIVNDGSTDSTATVMHSLVGRFPHQVRGINHDSQRGMGGSLATGFQTASGQVLTWLPADGEYQFAEVVANFDRLNEEDIILFRRTSRGQLHRGLISAAMHGLIRGLFRADLRDYSGIFLINARKWNEVRPATTSTLYAVEVALAAYTHRYRVGWATATWIPRRSGTSSVFRLRVVISSLLELLLLRMRMSSRQS